MPDNLPILSLIAFSPLLGILILLFIPNSQGKRLKVVGIATTFIPLVLSCVLFANFNNQSAAVFQFKEMMSWIHVPLNFNYLARDFSAMAFEFKYHLAVDGLSLPLVFLTALVVAMAALASIHIKKRWKSFYILFLLMEIGLLGVFMARDVILFFLFFEITLFTLFFLVGIWGYKEREAAANKFLLYNGLGSAVMLLAFLMLVCTAGFTIVNGSEALYTGDIQTIMANLSGADSFVNAGAMLGPGMDNPFFLSDTLKWAVFLMIVVAFGIKLPIFPFHTWMLKVHTEAPPAIVMIHSGVMLKMGAYGLLRFGVMLFPAQAQDWAVVLAILGVINILYGAVLAVVQKEFKLLLAYASISHMGIVLLGIAAFNQIGIQGAMFQMMSHGLISALLFLIVGSLYERTGTTDLERLGGLATTIPFIGGILLFAGLASLGLPGMSGYVGELLSFLGLFDSMPIITVVGMIGVILAAVYMLRGVLKITYGSMPERFQGLADARLIEAVPMIILVAFILLLGVYPIVLNEPLALTVSEMIQSFAKMGG